MCKPPVKQSSPKNYYPNSHGTTLSKRVTKSLPTSSHIFQWPTSNCLVWTRSACNATINLKTLSLYLNNIWQKIFLFYFYEHRWWATHSENRCGDGQYEKCCFILHVNANQRNAKLHRLVELGPLFVLAIVCPPQEPRTNWRPTITHNNSSSATLQQG